MGDFIITARIMIERQSLERIIYDRCRVDSGDRAGRVSRICFQFYPYGCVVLEEETAFRTEDCI